ncbi:MAG: cell division protein FtsZ [Fimbriimonadaceae bacterium]
MNPVNLFENQAVIKVVGVGGGGCNAVNRMIEHGVEGVEFVAMNTDAQALERSKADVRLPLGVNITRGLGTGGDPDKGERAARESAKSIQDVLDGADMVFVTAGMGGGTGTGATSIVSEISKRLGALTVCVVTTPFAFEGPRRARNAERGLQSLVGNVDTLISLPNEKLLSALERKTTLSEAFEFADEVLYEGVNGISDIIVRPGMVNLDFADIQSVLKDAGPSLLGIGVGQGENRAVIAAEAAVTSPMLDFELTTAKRMLVNITADEGFSIGEAQDVMEYLNQFVDAEDGAIYMGHALEPEMNGKVLVTLVAAEFGAESTPWRDEIYRDPTPRVQKREETPQPAPERTPGVERERERNIRPITAEELGLRGAEESAEPARRDPADPNVEKIDLDIPEFLRRHRPGE